MPQNSQTVVLIPKASYSSDQALAHIVVPEMFTAVRFWLKGDAATGTTPTLNLYLQGGIRDVAAGDTVIGGNTQGSLVWHDWVSWTQITTGAFSKLWTIVPSGNAEYATTDATQAAGSVKNGPIPARLRAKIDVGGTNPAYPNLQLIAEFIP
jgi:hypothetical protein